MTEARKSSKGSATHSANQTRADAYGLSRGSEAMATTRTAIEQAFLSLYERMPLESISATMVIEQACCSRATFYRYFKSVNDLLESIENKNTATRVCQNIIAKSATIPLEIASDAVIEFYDKRVRAVRILIGGSHREAYLAKQRATFKPMLHSLIVRAFDLTPMQQEYAAEYMARIKTVMIEMWVDKGCEIPLAQVNKMCDNVVETSFWTNIATHRETTEPASERVKADRHLFEYPWELSSQNWE